MPKLLKGAFIVNEGKLTQGDVLIKGQRIEQIDSTIVYNGRVEEIDAEGLHLMPGIIDDQVHFRTPGLTHKGTIETESRAAIAGGVTSYIDQPNVDPQTLTIELLREKKGIARRTSYANYGFNIGASNKNIDELKRANEKFPSEFAANKIFMGSSTGDMLVDVREILEQIFQLPKLNITHCEYEPLIIQNTEKQKAVHGEDIPFELHGVIRNEEVCLISSMLAVELARKHNARLHLYHMSTFQELQLFLQEQKLALIDKRLTGEACIPHLLFSSNDYKRLGSLIKQNPAIKGPEHMPEIFAALLDNRLDVIATDHAPHTWEEKQNKYLKSPSGAPWVQHSVPAGLQLFGVERIAKYVEKACHNPAILFGIEQRGFIREGYFADLTLVDMKAPWKVTPQNILYKCGWSAFEGHTFEPRVVSTFVNGVHVYDDLKKSPTGLGTILVDPNSTMPSLALEFNR